MARPNVIVEGQNPSGNYVPLKTNSSGELIVAGSVGGGSGAVQISDGSQTATITDVSGKKSLDVNVADITISHTNDSVAIGDGSNLAAVETIGGVNALAVSSKSVTYKKIVDEFDANTIYIGKAAVGSSGASAVWQIKKIVTSGVITTELIANGSDAFNQVWNNRTSLSYS
jgi:hypothetical protein